MDARDSLLNCCFPKSARLLRRADYSAFPSRQPKRSIGRFTIVETAVSPSPLPRLGLIVSRKFGKAHERNRFKRQVRESFRLHRHKLPEGLDILVKPRPLALKATYLEIQTELLHLISTQTARSSRVGT